MNPVETGKKYDTITHLWESDRFNRDNGMAAHRRALQFVTQQGRALDVGCGCTGRFIDLLLEEGFQPEGLDVSGKMLALALAAIAAAHADLPVPPQVGRVMGLT